MSRSRFSDAMNHNFVQIQQNPPTAAPFLRREFDKVLGWMQRHDQAERELRL